MFVLEEHSSWIVEWLGKPFLPLSLNYEPIKLRKLFRISYFFPSQMAKTTPSK